ncbi:MAG TPA: C2H2-type zinc finger protein [Actinomycetota bacterium]|nr:C2H2-type zinc finger protein [Actinomycetota bacterium]
MEKDDMPTGSFVCQCGETFGSEQELLEHGREAHGAPEAGEVEEFACPECNAVFATHELLEEHVQAHRTRQQRKSGHD